MKPLHSSFKRLSHCPCCQSKYNKSNKKSGKSAARQKAKKEIQKQIGA